MRSREPAPAGDALRNILRRIDPHDRMRAYGVWNFWNEEVGDSIARHAQPESLHAGVLTVRVDGAAWMQELQFLKEGIRERLNRRLGAALVHDLYFISGAVRSARVEEAESAAPARAARPLAPMPRLNDPQLAELFGRIARAHADRRR